MRDIIIPIGGSHPPDPDDECKLCKRKVHPSQLNRCYYCKKLFCKTCITEDLRENKYLICLNCARRFISPKNSKFKSKYTALTLYLSKKARWKRWIKLQFSEIEGIIENNLPETAYKIPKWWTTPNSIQAKTWNNIGWSIKDVNLNQKTVIFTRPKIVTPKKENNSHKKSPFVKLPEYEPKKTKTPSLTRIAIAQARLQNISRQKSSIKKHRGKFPPKAAYEKKLWNPEEKP